MGVSVSNTDSRKTDFSEKEKMATVRQGAPPDLAPGLYVTGTPIGNLKDITLRALEVLEAVDHVVCEDTRVTGKLLRHYGIDKPLTPYHDHNAAKMRPKILRWLAEGARVALVSDAGMPLVSDPGYRLVRAAQDGDIPVRSIPGPAAAVAALSVAGLATNHFHFEGFLPGRAKARGERLAALTTIDATLIFYESARRLAASLTAMKEAFGDREAAVARELTKAFEEVRRDSLTTLAEYYTDSGPPKGEVVILVAPPSPKETDWGAVDARLRECLGAERLKEAVERVAGETGAPRRAVYQRALALKDAETE